MYTGIGLYIAVRPIVSSVRDTAARKDERRQGGWDVQGMENKYGIKEGMR